MADGTWDRIAGKWKQLRGDIRSRWGDLTDDDVERIAGKRDQFVGVVQEKYGIAKDEAERQIDKWVVDNRYDYDNEHRSAKLR